MKKQKKAASFGVYLNSREKNKRIKILKGLHKDDFLPISLAEDLLVLDLSIEEKTVVLETTSSTNNLAYEHFLTANLLEWPQDLSSRALRLWDERTEHLLWYRLYDLAKMPHLPQRVRYTILDICWQAGGKKLLEAIAKTDGLEDLSPLFHALFLQRSMQWSLPTDQAKNLATSLVNELKEQTFPDNKAIAPAINYLARYEPKKLAELLNDQKISETWRDLFSTLLKFSEGSSKQIDKITKFIAKPPKTKVVEKFQTLWPPSWLRDNMSTETISGALQFTYDNEIENWEIFSGIGQDKLVEAVVSLESEIVFTKSLFSLGGLLPLPATERILNKLKDSLSTTESLVELLEALPLRLRLELTEQNSGDSVFSLIAIEEKLALSSKKTEYTAFSDYRDINSGKFAQDREYPEELEARKNFFDLAYRGVDNKKTNGGGLWQLLYDCWKSPDADKLSALASTARKSQGVFQICYLNTLGRFKGHDNAVLKTLDFVRSPQPDELKAVISALSGIDTPRASQELIASLTRPNITQPLQIEICHHLKQKNVSNLQKELRGAINDLSFNPDTEDGRWELKDELSTLLVAQPEGASEPSQSSSAEPSGDEGAGDKKLDDILKGKLPNYMELSGEVKRALRTSQFFHSHVSASGAPDSIDLSPVIDMQYKALELLFREIFESSTSQLIQKGVLQRRLDVIGYARPIKAKMDEFENYVKGLPIIHQIPFFSKFKLRKMLRGICLFRPGKRFTLDGLKAFALFFLCFSRHECRYDLRDLYNLNFKDDAELFNFCKSLHIFQDLRNRAAHEGFHPDASNDINGIWRQTAEIIQTVFRVQETMDEDAELRKKLKNSPPPVIEMKVS